MIAQVILMGCQDQSTEPILVFLSIFDRRVCVLFSALICPKIENSLKWKGYLLPEPQDSLAAI
jgi:hypothetical protein